MSKRCYKNVDKKILILFILFRIFCVNFQKTFLVLHWLLVYFFGELSTIVSPTVIQVYSRNIPSKVGIIYD